MTSFRIKGWKSVIHAYHKFMHDYNYILYRDCLDIQMKITLFQKMIHHRAKMDKNK